MFTLNKCLVHYCKNHSLSTFDKDGNICDEKSYCIDHIPNPGKIKNDIYNYVATHDTIVGLNACGLIFANEDFSNKKFFGCDFTHCAFVNVHSENFLLKMCFFDFSTFNDCNFIHGKSHFNSFSMATFAHSLYTLSDLFHNNFNGIKTYQCSFDKSDLFCSRFIGATLTDTSFKDCNLTKTVFLNTKRANVSFKMANTREAIFDVPPENDEAQKKEKTENSSGEGGKS